MDRELLCRHPEPGSKEESAAHPSCSAELFNSLGPVQSSAGFGEHPWSPTENASSGDAGPLFCGMYDGGDSDQYQSKPLAAEVESQGLGSRTTLDPLAAGIFQELRYPIPQTFPGPQPGKSARFDLSFRDVSGHKAPTSHAYLNRISPATKHWKGLRLDYGPNVKTNNAVNWHWNQDGAGKAFGISDHALASPTAAKFGRIMQVAKPLGRGAMVVGALTDSFSLGSNIGQSVHTGNWDNTVEDGSRIAGGWGGAWLGAKGGGMAGAGIGTLICPGLGTAIGGAVGGLAGGIGGYVGGSAVGQWAGAKLSSLYHGMFD